jgi:hypothetical protein
MRKIAPPKLQVVEDSLPPLPPLSKTVDYAVAYFRKNENLFYMFAPMVDSDGKKVGLRRLQAIRRNIARWENHEFDHNRDTERVLQLINKPLAAFFPVIPYL